MGVIPINYNRPIVKWAGGKYQMLPKLFPLIPKKYGKYIEPFFGGGALFFAHEPKNSIINDENNELMDFYLAARDFPDDLIVELEKFKNTKDEFYRIRNIETKNFSLVEKASRFYFLNKTCFNGLYRVNKKGVFNVPYAGYEKRKIFNKSDILRCSKILKKSHISAKDYKYILNKRVKNNDFIFIDPPYLPLDEKPVFNRYNSKPFGIEDHYELAEIVDNLSTKGCQIILTNSNNPLVYNLYKNMDIRSINVNRSINCKGGMKKYNDVIITNIDTKEENCG